MCGDSSCTPGVFEGLLGWSVLLFWPGWGCGSSLALSPMPGWAHCGAEGQECAGAQGLCWHRLGLPVFTASSPALDLMVLGFHNALWNGFSPSAGAGQRLSCALEQLQAPTHRWSSGLRHLQELQLPKDQVAVSSSLEVLWVVGELGCGDLGLFRALS